MKEKRKFARRRPNYYLKVLDESTQELKGSLVDISQAGMMLAGRQPIKVDAVHTFRMALPDSLQGERQVVIKARSVWCNQDIDSDFFDYYSAGFEFDNPAPSIREVIDKSTRSYLFHVE
jgi:c-di-GMP-binding flagellar brake protein YcgR